jgi:tetratricopeptide (TPR) repeat protein
VVKLGRCSVVVVFLLLVVTLIIVAGCANPLSEAGALEKKGDLEGAVALYREILANSPKDLRALSGLEVDLLQMQRYDEALPVQEAIVALDPKDALTRVELAFNYLNHQGQPAKAVQYLTEAVALDPSAKNLSFLAQAQTAAGHAQKAEQTLRKAIATDKTYPYAYELLLAMLKGQGRASEAAGLREAAKSAGVVIVADKSD